MKSQAKIWVFYNVKSRLQTRPLHLPQAQVYILSLKSNDLNYTVAWTPGWEKWVHIKEVMRAYPDYFATPPPTNSSNSESTQLIDVTDVKTKKTRRVRTQTVTNTQSSITNTALENTYTEIALHDHPPAFKDREFLPEEADWDKTPAIPELKRKLEPSHSSGEERREYRRFPHRIEIVLMTKKGRSFRSSSKDISLGGVKLREPVPSDLLKDTIDLVVVNPFPDEQTPSHLLIKGRIVGDLRDRRRLTFYEVSPEVKDKLQIILENYKKNYAKIKKKKAA